MHYIGKSKKPFSVIISLVNILCITHYIGQFAIDFFHLSYKVGYVAGAVVIACAAVVTALYIFFKLREHWSNRWYKRLGSSMLMGLAVCGTVILFFSFPAPIYTQHMQTQNTRIV